MGAEACFHHSVIRDIFGRGGGGGAGVRFRGLELIFFFSV